MNCTPLKILSISYVKDYILEISNFGIMNSLKLVVLIYTIENRVENY